MNEFLAINSEVRQALDAAAPVVAFESTISSHGMPYPQNLETARRVEHATRETGATPATIAVMDGQLRVGLSDGELELLAKNGQKSIKASRRDLPFVLTRGGYGTTTVAATMIIAHMAGIKIFATGGIGGVHRGAGQSMDISADLEELARTNVAVVCAGPKAILDIGLTLEYLETKGVAVIGYQTDELPAFYSRNSGFGVDYRCDTLDEIATLLSSKEKLCLRGGMVITNPVPHIHSMDPDKVNKIVQQVELEVADLGITGKNVTPHMLARIEELTTGESLQTNVQLILENARLAAEIAIALANKN